MFLLFLLLFFDGLMYLDFAKVSDYHFSGKYLAKAFMMEVHMTEKYKVNDMEFGEELIISIIRPKTVG